MTAKEGITMKKLFCAVALSLALSIPVHAFAVDLSALDLFSSMSVYDLLRARNILSEELMKRGYSEYTLSKGMHTVGESIQPGIYTLADPTLLNASFIVYSPEGNIEALYCVDYSWKYHESTERKGRNQIELKEGQVLKLYTATTFYKY